jgi:hypothetical protein
MLVDRRVEAEGAGRRQRRGTGSACSTSTPTEVRRRNTLRRAGDRKAREEYPNQDQTQPQNGITHHQGTAQTLRNPEQQVLRRARHHFMGGPDGGPTPQVARARPMTIVPDTRAARARRRQRIRRHGKAQVRHTSDLGFGRAPCRIRTDDLRITSCPILFRGRPRSPRDSASPQARPFSWTVPDACGRSRNLPAVRPPLRPGAPQGHTHGPNGDDYPSVLRRSSRRFVRGRDPGTRIRRRGCPMPVVGVTSNFCQSLRR